MAKHYKKALEFDDPDDGLEFPEPRATKQYSAPIGPTRPTDAPMVATVRKPSIFQRIADVAAPGLAGESRALGKRGVKSIAKDDGVAGIRNVGQRVGSLIVQPSAPPVWLMDQTRGRGGKRKQRSVQIPGTDLPPWMFGGGMPWDRPTQKSDVERVIVTRVHADGTRTTTTRIPRDAQSRRGPTRPGWINF